MRTNVLNDLSNVVKKGAGLACSWSQVGRMSEGGAIEHPLSTHSAPFGIRWKPAGNKAITSFNPLRLAAMITLLLTLACGNVWAYWYLPGTIHYNAWGNGDNQMNGDNTIVFYAVPAGTYYFKLSNGTSQSGHNILSSYSGSQISSTGTDNGQTKITLSSAADLTFHVTNESTWMVSLVASAPSYMIKYKWNNGDWAWSMPMTDNGDGTYSCVGKYGGTSYNKIKKTQNHTTGDSGTATTEGSPSNGNMCVFTYTASTGALKIRKCKTMTKTDHIYFDNTNANWTQTYMYFVIGRPINDDKPYSKMYRIQQISNTMLWYTADGDTWSDAGYYAIAGGSSAWDNGTNWGPTALKGWTKRSAPLFSTIDMVNGGSYVVTKENGTNDAAIAISRYGSGTGYSVLNNLSVGFKYALSSNGGAYTDMSSGKTPGQVNMAWYKFNAVNSVTSQTAKNINANSTPSNYYQVATSLGYRSAVTLTESNTQTGYTFVGWYDGSTEKSTANPYTYYPAENCTITARFRNNLYYVRFIKNDEGASGSMSNQTHYYGASQALTSCGFTAPSGKVFAGWATTSSGSKAYSNGETVSNLSSTDGATVDLYALWGYALTYDKNTTDEVSNMPTTPVGVNAGSITLATEIPVRSGYVFVGWQVGGSGTIYQPGGAYTMPSSAVTMKAKWVAEDMYISNATPGTWGEDKSNGDEITSTHISGSISGGTVVYSGSGTMGCNSTAGLVFDNNNDQITVTLTGLQFVAGSVIVIDARGRDNTSSHTCGFTVSGIAPTPATVTSSEKWNAFRQLYTVTAEDALNGTSSFTLERKSTSEKVYLYSLHVGGCEEPSCSATANAGADKSTTVGVGVAMAATAASSGYTGAWSIKTGSPSTSTSQLSSTSAYNATFTPTAAGTYTLIWTVTDDSDGSCYATDEADVTVTKNTPSDYTASGGTFCSDAGVVTLDGSQSGISYQLYNGASTVGDAKAGTGSALTWTGLSTAANYTVKSVANDAYNAATMSGTATVAFYDAVSIGTQPTASVNATVSSAANLSGLALSSGTFNNAAYQWQTCTDATPSSTSDITSDGGGLYANYTTSTLSFTASSVGTYYFRCKVTDGCGTTVYSNVVTVTAKNQPAQYTVSGTASICSGDDTNITLSDSEDGVSYQLYKGASTEGAAKAGTGNALTWSVSEAGTYTVKSVENTNYWERAMSSSATVSFKTATSISTQPATAVDATVNEDFTLGSALVAAGDGTLQYQWFSYSNAAGDADETSVRSASTTKTFTTSQASAGTYYYRVKVIGVCGTVASDVIAVTVSACSPTTLISATLSSCTSTGDVTGTPGGSSAVAFSSCKELDGGYKMGKDDSYMYLTLSSGKFEAGDKVSITITQANDGVGDGALHVYKYMSSTWTELGSTPASTAGTFTYTLTAANVATDFNCIGLYRESANQNPYVKSLTVTRPCSGYAITNGEPSHGTIAITDGSSAITTAEEDATVHIEATPADGYSFGEWTVTKDAGGSIDVATSSSTNPTTFSMPGEDVTVTASFTPNTYTITYNLNGASWAGAYDAPATYTVGTGATLPVAGDMTNTGYTFDGWYANSDLSTGGVKTEVGSSEYGDKEFWAKWTENTYTITYNANGGSGSTTATEGHYVTVADNGFTAPDGKTFVEWNTLSTGSGVSYAEGDEIELTADMTLYAIWSKSVGTINWTVTKIDSKLYRGGGGYSIKAEINDAAWDATAADSSKLELTASEGVVLRNIVKSINGSGKAQITANFDITTTVSADATKITFTLNVPENNSYAPKSDDHDESLTSCGGGTIFAMHMTAYNTCEVNSTYGGSASLGGYSSSSGDNVTANGHTHYKPSGTLLTATLKSGFTFQAGDVVTLYMTASKDTKTTGYKICKNSGSSTLVQDVTEEMKSGREYEVSATLTAAMTTIVGATSIRLDRYNSDVRFYGMEVVRSGGGSSVSPTLTWSPALYTDGDWDTDHLEKKTGDADFTYTVTQDKNSLGAITYSSSNTSVATVNATTGKVHIAGSAGNATITATLAASGCYNQATASYNITVVDNCEDEAGTIGTEDLGCSGIKLTVTGHTTTASTSYQWYKDGGAVSDSTRSSFIAERAGEYYVVVTNTGEGHCPMASTNTVTVEASETATASKIVDSWYVKDGRRTPDIALVQTANADTFQVKIGSSPISTFAGCAFYLGNDGIIYLKGQKDDGTAPSGLSAGDETLKFTAIACGGNSDELSITIHKQASTTYPSVAYISIGTKNGLVTDTTAGYYKTASLYKYLDQTLGGGGFDLTARNAYWSVNEKELKEHYSQFDAILITDDPSTSTKNKDKGGESFINAIGCLVDVRPILTMEAYVSKWSNWKAKGIDGDPTSPNPRQYGMKLQCKDHEIFNGLEVGGNVKQETIDGTNYWTVLMVDSTKSPYTGIPYNEQTGQKEKPAMQGFSSSDVSGLLLLGEISDGAYYAGVERQEEPAARLMLLGIQYQALPNALTNEGKIIIKNALKYLLKTNMEEVDDCSNYFTGATSTDWNTANNWSKKVVPNSPMVRARILAPCEITGITVKAAQIDIVTSGTSSKKAGEMTGKLTINPTGTLIVGGKIRSAEAPYFNIEDLKPTEEEDLVIKTSSTAQAALVFNNDKGDTKATVNLYSLGRTESSAYQFQYFAVPMSYIDVNPTFAGSGIYTYVWHEASGWERRGYYTGLEAFEGVGITTKFDEASHNYTMKGTLASTETKEIALTNDGNGQNMIGNSWTAPIQISELDEDNTASEITKTVYIYCAGNGNTMIDGTTETPGQWLAIPFSAAGFSGWGGLKVIPAMQAFTILTSGTSTFTLDYDKVVRGGSTDLNAKLRAPKRRTEAESEGIDLIRIRVADSQTHTDLYLFEGEQFSEEFDNGWEAKYMSGDGRSAKLYAETAIGPMAVVAQPEYEGTVLGFAPGKETEYTFTFSGPNKEYYLNDLKEKKSTLISEDESYMFTFEEGDTNRFYISKTPINAPSVATGMENTGDGAKARKVIYNNHVYIIRAGKVYGIDGTLVVPNMEQK